MAEGGVVDYTGKLFNVKGLFSPWKNLPIPPLYVGANREKMLNVAAQKADGVMFSDMPPDNATKLVERVRTELLRNDRALGRFRFSNWFVWNVQKTMEEAERIAQRHLGFRLYYVRDVAASLGLDQRTVDSLEGMQSRMDRAIFEGKEPELPSKEVTGVLVNHLTITGSRENLSRSIETLHEFEKRGLHEIALALEGDPVSSIKLLGDHVVPELDTDRSLRPP
jgi:alkanesulfonate monooxygenase SsuD/methylene tetrahydromethanopterin reductase-like flavin-dependent oxidoreductase (luciferase family)